jgi:phosphatidylinositol glycan class V
MPPSRAVILKHPLRTLLWCFVAWKSLLLLVAIASPGRGYDTSTSLVLTQNRQLPHDHPSQPRPLPRQGGGDGPLPAALHHIATRLTRWDAIYFSQVAARGYRFEQEWAFGWGFTRLIVGATARTFSRNAPQMACL